MFRGFAFSFSRRITTYMIENNYNDIICQRARISVSPLAAGNSWHLGFQWNAPSPLSSSSQICPSEAWEGNTQLVFQTREWEKPYFSSCQRGWPGLTQASYPESNWLAICVAPSLHWHRGSSDGEMGTWGPSAQKNGRIGREERARRNDREPNREPREDYSFQGEGACSHQQ